MFEKIKIEDVNLSKLKVGDYFVIKDFAIETKHTSWFNGTNFDSSKIKYVLIQYVGQTDV
jgi:ERCC4-type nuclease